MWCLNLVFNSSESIFTGQAANAYGQYTQYTRGNGQTTTNAYDDFGMPLITATPGVQYLENTFDLASGDLTVLL